MNDSFTSVNYITYITITYIHTVFITITYIIIQLYLKKKKRHTSHVGLLKDAFMIHVLNLQSF